MRGAEAQQMGVGRTRWQLLGAANMQKNLNVLRLLSHLSNGNRLPLWNWKLEAWSRDTEHVSVAS